MNQHSENMLERLERIKRKLNERNAILNAKLPQKDIEDLEARYQIYLPEEYRQFLINIGDGGNGPPAYGLVSVRESLSLLSNKNFHPNLPFPLDKMWIWENEITMNKELEQRLNGVRFHGHIFLGTNGCGEDWILIIAGNERGYVWNRADVGAMPCIPSRDFLSWYEFWLDGSKDWFSMNNNSVL
jgi:hypothetical protein